MSCSSYFDALVFDKNKVKKIFLPYKKKYSHKIKVEVCFYRCMYKGIKCKEKHFSQVLTDFGVCSKFDPSNDTDFANQTSTGETLTIIFFHCII